MQMIDKEKLEQVLENLNWIKVKTEEVETALEQYLRNNTVEYELGEKILSDILKDEPNWSFDIISSLEVVLENYRN